MNLVSVIMPAYNEEFNISEAIERVLAVFIESDYLVEVLVVDNCSSDNTGKIVKEKAALDSRIKYLKFTRNFGPTVESSILAGYKYSTGDAAIVIYSDLQDPPELIPEFLALWRQGYDVVNGRQITRLNEPFWRKTSVKIFYRLMNKLSDGNTEIDSGDFKLLSRRVIDVITNLPERARYNRGLISWAGFKTTSVSYVRNPRQFGESSANFLAILGTAINGITSFSLKPLRVLTLSGILITTGSFMLALFYSVMAIKGNTIPGLTTITVLQFVMVGLNMLGFGILGEYIGRIQLEVKQRPQYLIDETVNI